MAESDDGGDAKTVQAFISGCFWDLPCKNIGPNFVPCIHALCKECIDKSHFPEDQRHKGTSTCDICGFNVQHQTEVGFATELREMVPQVLQLWMKVFDVKFSCNRCGKWLFPWAHYCEPCKYRLCLLCKERHESWHKALPLHTHILHEKLCRGHSLHERPLEIHCVGCAKSSCIACFIENDRTTSVMINSDYEETKRQMSLLRKNFGERKEQLFQEKQCIKREAESLVKEIDNQIGDLIKRLYMWGKGLKQQIKLNYEKKSMFLDSEMEQAKQGLATLNNNLPVFYSSILQGKEIADYLCKKKYFSYLKDKYNECTQQDFPKSQLCFKVSNILLLSNENIFGTVQERQQDRPLPDADKYDDSTKSLVENICSKVVKREVLEEILSISQNQHSFGTTKPFEDVELTITETVDEYHEMLVETKSELERITSDISREGNNNTAFAASLSILEKTIARQLKSTECFCGMMTSLYGRDKLSSSLQSKIDECATRVEELRKMLQRVIEQLKQPTPTGLSKNRDQSSTHCQKVAPLVNLGNTCFMNAVVQALFHTKIFARLLHMRFSNVLDERNQTLAVSFVELSFQMQSGKSGMNDIHPTGLYTTLNDVLKKFTDSNQHDSHDFFIQFLNKVRQEERDYLSRLCSTSREDQMRDPKTMLTAVDKVFGGHTLTVYICLRCKTPYHICEPFLSVSLPICEQASTQYPNRRDEGNQKQYKDWTFQPHTDYQRAIADALKPFSGFYAGEPGPLKNTIISSLQHYTRFEHIDNEYLCTKCNEQVGAQKKPTMTPAKKQTLIYTPPAILTVHLKRFKQTSGYSGFAKINDHINFEYFLDIAPFCSSGCLNVDPSQGNIWYMLYAVVVHSGSLSSGHYVAYVLVRDDETDIKDFLQKRFLGRSDRFGEEEMIDNITRIPKVRKKFREKPKEIVGTWYRISDSQCDVVKYFPGSSYDGVLNQQAYMLFYERMLSTP